MAAPEPPSSILDTEYRRLCEHAGVALISTDVDLNIRIWNAAAVRIFGTAADRALDTPIGSVIPQNRRRMAERVLRRTLETGEINEFEFHDRDERGFKRELAGTVAPIWSQAGEPVGTVISIRDITRFVAQQTEQHESRKLMALGAMGGTIAHHFNNIVGGVITSIDFASASDDPELKGRVLRRTGEALARATSLIHGLLVFAEGEQHASDLADLTEVLNECADALERSIGGRNIELILNVPDLRIVPVPRAQMLTVLQNVTRNAIDAMPHGGTLRIDVRAEDDRIIIEVSDTGVGLEESAIPHIFEPFWSTKHHGSDLPGSVTGLGLAVAHGILKVMGGSIQVKSEPSKGSMFTVSLPLPRAK